MEHSIRLYNHGKGIVMNGNSVDIENKELKCPYCHGTKSLIDYEDTYMKIGMTFDGSALKLSASYSDEIYSIEIWAQYDYCPICGSRLNNENS